jgi:hypothetical protein
MIFLEELVVNKFVNDIWANCKNWWTSISKDRKFGRRQYEFIKMLEITH